MKALTILLLVIAGSACFGQQTEPKFGVIDPNDLSMKSYNSDTTAEALILFDKGSTEFMMNAEGDGFQTSYKRHMRIKIFRKTAFDLGNFSVRLYRNNSAKEKLINVKVTTYNLDKGNIVKTKIDKDNIFEEETKNYVITKFACPDVREGSIIEFEYTINSPFLYNLRGWTFQYNYPALWSQYSFSIPEYFKYHINTKGYLAFSTNKKTTNTSTFSIRYRDNSAEGIDHQTNSGLYTLKPYTTTTILETTSVPAFKSEPDIDCEDNYIQSVEFELMSIQYPGQQLKDFTQTWESVNKQMLEDEDFGTLLKSKGFISDTVEAVCRNKTTDLDKATSIYNDLQTWMKWNGKYSTWAINGLSRPYKERAGNSCEINLILTLMLRTAGLNANPVLLSTRDNGIVLNIYPSISKYNTVISKLTIGDKIYLLDATSRLCPLGVLPANDINGQGREVNDLGGGCVDLETKTSYKEMKFYTMDLNGEGVFTGTIKGFYYGYAGINYRRAIEAEKNEQELIKRMEENMRGLKINGFKIINKDMIYSPLSDSMNVEIADLAEVVGDKIIFSPLLFEKMEKNRYTLEERSYPVNTNYPLQETYVFEIKLPEGYQVESLPKPVLLKTPQNEISITYNIKNTDNKIQLTYMRSVNKTTFLAAEYPGLKEFYNQIVKKHSESVILKKTGS